MKKSVILLSKIAGIAAATLLLGASAFADSRPLFATVAAADQGRDYDRDRHERRNVTIEGRVTNITREREGYRVSVDHGEYVFWVRDLYAGRHGHGALRIGINVRLAGVYEPRYGTVIVDSYDWLDEGPAPVYRGELIHGTIDRINRHDQMLWLRLDNGHVVSVDMTRNDRHWNRDHGYDIDQLHRGDRVTFSGNWTRRDLFFVHHVENVHYR